MRDAFGSFFLPGPTEVRPEVLRAMAQPMLPHRGAAYQAMHREVVDGLQVVFGTRRPVYIMTASATGMMEAAIRNAPAGPVLALVNGHFSERFARIAQSCDRRTRVLGTAWGGTHALAEVEAALAAERFAAVCVVHVETSTGAMSDVRALTTLAHRYGAVCLVDSVSGAGGVALETDAWGLDFVFTGSQKALAMPPGLAFGVASESFILQVPAAPSRGRYFDLAMFEEFAAKDQSPHTPAVSLVYAAQAQLRRLHAEGLEARLARHVSMRQTIERWVATNRREGVAIDFLAPGDRAPTVSALVLPEGTHTSDVVRRTADLGFTIGAGSGPMRESVLRIGHMGDHTVEGLSDCLSAVRRAL